jgi:hypothetical protein
MALKTTSDFFNIYIIVAVPASTTGMMAGERIILKKKPTF